MHWSFCSLLDSWLTWGNKSIRLSTKCHRLTQQLTKKRAFWIHVKSIYMPSISDISVALFLTAKCGHWRAALCEWKTCWLSDWLFGCLFGWLSASTEINWSKATSATVKVQKCHSTFWWHLSFPTHASPWGRLFDPMLWSICQNIFSARHLSVPLCVLSLKWRLTA